MQEKENCLQIIIPSNSLKESPKTVSIENQKEEIFWKEQSHNLSLKPLENILMDYFSGQMDDNEFFNKACDIKEEGYLLYLGSFISLCFYSLWPLTTASLWYLKQKFANSQKIKALKNILRGDTAEDMYKNCLAYIGASENTRTSEVKRKLKVLKEIMALTAEESRKYKNESTSNKEHEMQGVELVITTMMKLQEINQEKKR